MASVMAQPRVLRPAAVTCVLLALVGPWAYDRINVPAEFACQAPYVRLGGDYCGLPLSGVWLLTGLGQELASFAERVAVGELRFDDLGRALLYLWALMMMLLPILGLIWRPQSRHVGWRWVRVVMTGLAVATTIFFLSNTATMELLRLWGVWLYAGAVFLLVLDNAMGNASQNKRQLST